METGGKFLINSFKRKLRGPNPELRETEITIYELLADILGWPEIYSIVQFLVDAPNKLRALPRNIYEMRGQNRHNKNTYGISGPER